MAERSGPNKRMEPADDFQTIQFIVTPVLCLEPRRRRIATREMSPRWRTGATRFARRFRREHVMR